MNENSADQPARRQMFELPLRGVMVVDLVEGPLAATGRLLAELGADVVRVATRGDGAHGGGGVDRAMLEFVAGNLGKRTVTLGRDDSAGLDALLADADILIENMPVGSDAAARLDVAGLRRRYPELVILSVSNFGQTGDYRDWQATDAVLHALSGELSRSGIPGREPLLPPGEIALQCAAVQAAYVALLAYLNRLRTGVGDHLDFSLLDAASQALDPGYGIAGSATAGIPASKLPRGRAEARHQYPIIPCADGYVRLCVLAPRQWQGMFEWMGRPEEFADPSFNTLQARFASPTLVPAIARFFADKNRADLEEAGQRYGVPTAALLDLEEAIVSPQMIARDAFRSVEVAPGVEASFPNGVIEIDGARAGIREPVGAQDRVDCRPAVDRAGELPLKGLRVLDLGVIVVGAEQGRLLGDHGADVIKIENAAFPDGSRQTRDGSPISVAFSAGHRNKRGVSLNLRDPKGKALFLRLVEQADVLLSNFKPGTLDSLGFDRKTLSEVNPRLIAVDSSAFGPTGPWSRRLGYGPLVRASTGLTGRWSYPGEPGGFSDALTVYPDHVAGRIGVIGVLALLIRRRRTGRGGTVSVSQAEVMLSHMAAEIAAASLAEAGRTIEGEPARDAPWGVFPCAGDDEWCVVTVRHDADWLALCGVIERPDLAGDPALASRASRDAARERIDAALRDWLGARSPIDAMERLQAGGVPAGAMLRVAELPDFAYFRRRGLFREARHPMIAEPFMLETRPVRSSNLPDAPDGLAPLMGEHSAEVVREWLGLDEEEIAALIDTDILGVVERGQ